MGYKGKVYQIFRDKEGKEQIGEESYVNVNEATYWANEYAKDDESLKKVYIFSFDVDDEDYLTNQELVVEVPVNF